MCVYIYIYRYMYVYVYKDTYMYIHTYKYTWCACVHMCTSQNEHTGTHTHMYADRGMQTSARINTNTHAREQTQTADSSKRHSHRHSLWDCACTSSRRGCSLRDCVRDTTQVSLETQCPRDSYSHRHSLRDCACTSSRRDISERVSERQIQGLRCTCRHRLRQSVTNRLTLRQNSNHLHVCSMCAENQGTDTEKTMKHTEKTTSHSHSHNHRDTYVAATQRSSPSVLSTKSFSSRVLHCPMRLCECAYAWVCVGYMSVDESLCLYESAYTYAHVRVRAHTHVHIHSFCLCKWKTL